MSAAYASVVQTCLQCIEDGMDAIQDFTDQDDDVQKIFQKKILEPLNDQYRV